MNTIHAGLDIAKPSLQLHLAGKPAKVALTAVMRKLLILMNHTLKNPNFILQN